MSNDKKSLHEEAIDLLERINQELKDSRYLNTLNTKMVGVVKDLNEVRIDLITGNGDTEKK